MKRWAGRLATAAALLALPACFASREPLVSPRESVRLFGQEGFARRVSFDRMGGGPLSDMVAYRWNGDGYDIVDVKKEPEDAYAEHCREVDMATAPLRDCMSYYNGHGEAEPGSLAYYGGGRWHKYRIQAQETLAPYVFGHEGAYAPARWSAS